MNIILVIGSALVGIIAAIGVAHFLAGAFSMPPKKSTKAIRSTMHENGTTTERFERMLLLPVARKLRGLVKLDAYHKKELDSDLQKLGYNYDAETYYGKAIAEALFCVVLAFVCFFSPLMMVLFCVVGAVVMLAEFTRVPREIKKYNHIIENELPRMVEELDIKLRDNRDLIRFFDGYIPNTKGAFRKSLETLAFEMKTGHALTALRNFEFRMRMPQVSQLVQVLAGVVQGVAPQNAIYNLAMDLRVSQKEAIRIEDDKKPTKMMVPMVLLVVASFIILGVSYGLIILSSTSGF